MATSTLETTATTTRSPIYAADWGRKEINIAEHEMPAWCRSGTSMRRASRWPGAVTGSLHMTIRRGAD